MQANRRSVDPRIAVLAAIGWAATFVLRAIGQQSIAPAAYICPMHPDVVARTAGTCPKCGMALALADPYDAREFLVAVDTAPAAPIAGRKTRIRLTVREPSTRAVVRDFVEVHEKPYHLFVISHDLEHYDHLHPQQQPDGSHVVDVTLPKPGYYRLYSDFLPLGATPQVIPGVLVTANLAPGLAAARARLVPDAPYDTTDSRESDPGVRRRAIARTAGGMRVTLTLPADGFVAGRDEKLQYHVADAATGAPITDMEPYLAAFGHTLVISDDTLHYVHAHPIEIVPGGGAAARGGPDLTFKALMPKPGRYRIWTQLKRNGVVSTVWFTVTVASPARQ